MHSEARTTWSNSFERPKSGQWAVFFFWVKKMSKAELLFRLFPRGKHFLFSLFFSQESIEQTAQQAKQVGKQVGNSLQGSKLRNAKAG